MRSLCWRFGGIFCPDRSELFLSLSLTNLRSASFNCFALPAFCFCLPPALSGLAVCKTLGVITPTAGVSPELFGVAYLKRPGFRMSLAVPHSRGEVAGVAGFLGLRVVASGPYIRQIARTEILSKGCASQLRNKFLWKTGARAPVFHFFIGRDRACPESAACPE